MYPDCKNKKESLLIEIYVISAARDCKVTDYARMNGAYRSSSSGYARNGYWWLRSPGNYSNYAAFVDNDGWGDLNGDLVCNGKAIRPALRINLSSSAWEAAGTVSTELGAVDPDQPTQTPKPSMTLETSKAPNSTDVPQATSTPVVTETPKPTTEPSATPNPTDTLQATPTPTPAPANDSTQTADDKVQLKTIKLSSVIYKRNSTKISGKVSVTGATVKIKVGSKAYKKAVVKGKKFTLKFANLKKKTKVIIKVK